MRPEPDLSLVRRARRGDRDALTTLVRRHETRVHTIARGIVGDPHSAADVSQETFIAAIGALDRFQETAAFTTWLHRIAVRKALDHVRRRAPVPVDPDGLAVGALEARAGGEADAGLRRGALLDAITGLDEGYREAVLLVDVLGASVGEAAEALDVAPGTIKSRCFRGRAQLARALGTAGIEGASDW